jgi:predicted  nucleic acid-binding Zn-ribbon protein
VCQFQGLLAPMNKEERDTLKELSTMAKDNSRLKNKIKALTLTISTLQDQKAKISEDLKAVKEENELLRGQRQLLLERLNNAGISLGNIKL